MTRIITEKGIEIPLRDGTITRADMVHLDQSEAAPAILYRLPYGKDEFDFFVHLDPMRAVQAGYVVVIQDTRGRCSSEGTFDPLFDEKEDGYDTVEWIAEQPWCNGKVGMTGPSYLGATQWLTASQRPPHLCAIIPVVTSSDYYENWVFQGGAFNLGFNLSWTYGVSIDTILRMVKENKASMDDINQTMHSLSNISEQLKIRPYKDAVNKKITWYQEWLNHPTYDDYWKKISPKVHHHEIDTPVFNVGGWFDVFLGGTLDNYCGRNERKAASNHLLIGPWSHGDAFQGVWPELDFGLMAGAMAIGLQQRYLRFFDFWMMGEQNGLDKDAPVEIFVMGENQWRKAESWPLPETIWTAFYLHSNGKANTLSGDGCLSTAKPGAEQEDIYLFDPRNPVPTIGGQTLIPGILTKQGPKDLQESEKRADVLCYTSEPQTQPVDVIGPVKAKLYVSSSAKDTDFTAKLVDVQPDGRALILTDGILRARFRNSMEKPEIMEQGKIYELEIDMWATGNRFLPGHRIRVEISSSNFPRFDVNTNTGGNIAEETDGDMVQAVNRIYHTEKYPSHVILPLISIK